MTTTALHEDEVNNSRMPRDPGDSELVAAARAGSQQAFGELVDRHQSVVCAVTYALTGSFGQSEEVAQEAFLAAWRGLPELREPERFRPWLCGIARHLSLNSRRGRKVEVPLDTIAGREGQELASAQPSPLDRFIDREEQQALWVALRKLPERYRVPMVLFYREQRSVERVAQSLDLTVDNVKQRLSRGRKMLHEQMTSLLDSTLARTRPGKEFAAAVAVAIASGLASQASASTRTTTPKAGGSRVALLAAGTVCTIALLTAGGIWYAKRAEIRRRISIAHAGTLAATPAVRLLTPPPPWAADPDAQPSFIEGTVQDRQGRPLVGALVAAVPFLDTDGANPRLRPAAVVRSGPGGDFHLDNVRPGQYGATVTKPGYLPAHRGGLSLYPGQPLTGIRLVLDKGGMTVTGRVEDVGGGPIPGAQVLASEFNITKTKTALYATTADANGTYQLTVPAGPTSLVADADGYAPASGMALSSTDQTVDLYLAPAGRFSGKVVERGTGAPVAGAEVHLMEDRLFVTTTAREAKTDADGTFHLDDLDPGSYALMARKGSLVGRLGSRVNIMDPGRPGSATVEVEPGLSITGLVRGVGGAVIADAKVRLHGSLWEGTSRVHATSDARGGFRVDGILPGEIWLSAEAPGYARARRSLKVSARDATPVELTMAREAVLSGRVVTGQGAAVAGAAIVVMNPEAFMTGAVDSRYERSREDGTFRIERIGEGPLALSADHAKEGSSDVVTVRLKPGEAKELTLTLRPGATVSGIVRWDDGQPAGGVTVTGMGLPSATAETRSAADGSYTLGPFPPGKVTLHASRKSGMAGMFSDSFMEVKPSAKARTQVVIEGNEARTGFDLVVLRGGLRIAGTVLDPQGKPLTSATMGAHRQSTDDGAAAALAMGKGMDSLRAVMGEKRIASAQDGSFAIEDLSAGNYLVWAKYPGLPDAEVGNVRAGATGVRLSFKKPATVAGVVVRADGTPLGDYQVVAVSKSAPRAGKGHGSDAVSAVGFMFGGAPKASVHDRRGLFEIGALGAGEYELQVTATDNLVGRATVTLAEAQALQDVRIAVEAGKTLRGRVVAPGNGKAFGGAMVILMAGASTAMKTIDADGKFLFDGLAPGEVTLMIQGGNGAMSFKEITLPADRDALDLGAIPLAKDGAKSLLGDFMDSKSRK